MSDPYRVETYCGRCHDTKTHYLKLDHTINGCPKCYEARKAQGLFPLHASVRQVSGAQEDK